MKKILIGVSSIFSFLFLGVSFAVAATPVGLCVSNPSDPSCVIANAGIASVLGSIVQFIFVIAVILALGFLVYGGIRWITSGGDKEGVAKARGTIIAAIIGLIVIVLSYFILNFVLTFLGVPGGLSGVTIPSLTGGGMTVAEALQQTADSTTCGGSGDNACGPFSIDDDSDPATAPTTHFYCKNGDDVGSTVQNC
ncbi:MAG: pilin [bacterium]|nr:pilin [bacterium]